MSVFEYAVNNPHLPQISDGSNDPEKNVITEAHADSLEEGLDPRPNGNLIYSINDRPPWYLCILLGFQVRHNMQQISSGRLSRKAAYLHHT